MESRSTLGGNLADALEGKEMGQLDAHDQACSKNDLH